MEQLIPQIQTIMGSISTEVMVVVFTIVGALITSIIEIRKRKKLKLLQRPTTSDAAFDLALKAMETVEAANADYTKKYDELIAKYDELEMKYHRQIEINTAQSEEMMNLRIELLYFRTQMDPNYADVGVPVDSEDSDPGYPDKDI